MTVNPENHFAVHYHAAVYLVLAFVRELRGQGGNDGDEVFDEYPFLAQYLAEDLHFMPEDLTWDKGGAWWMTEIQKWEEQSDRHLPLRAMSRQLQLSGAQRLAFVVAGLLEEDSRFGTFFADLQASESARRPTVELLGRIVKPLDCEADGWGICRPLVQSKLVEVVDRSLPQSEWSLRVPYVLWEMAKGLVPHSFAEIPDISRVQSADRGPDFEDLIVSKESLEKLRQVPTLVRDGTTRVVVVRGTPGSERRAALTAVARALGRGVVLVTGSEQRDDSKTPTLPDALGPFCVLSNTIPVLELDLAPGESRSLPGISGYSGPVGIALSVEGGLSGDVLDASVRLSLEPLSARERRQHWKTAFEDVEVEGLSAIVEGFQLSGRYLRRAGAAAVRQAALDGRETVTVADVRTATRTLGRQLLDTLAERLDVDGTWDHLIVEPRAEEKLHDLERRCHHRERLLDHLGAGFGRHTTKGVRALFTGPSGTGKTLAARILAAELGMDLYRVDLAAVINKYVGETEKNLHRVLSTAEELDVILLLDEGDALLGRRTQVASANDRYANVETNYLLQRLEHYSGIVLVTSNLADNIDPAFQRRMDLVVDFSPPSADERLAIWSLHLPADHGVSEAVLRQVAAQCPLNGGQIRNTALQATLLALDEARKRESTDREGASAQQVPENLQVTDEHLVDAVRDEYCKAGSACPLTFENGSTTGSTAQEFVRGIAS